MKKFLGFISVLFFVACFHQVIRINLHRAKKNCCHLMMNMELRQVRIYCYQALKRLLLVPLRKFADQNLVH